MYMYMYIYKQYISMCIYIYKAAIIIQYFIPSFFASKPSTHPTLPGRAKRLPKLPRRFHRGRLTSVPAGGGKEIQQIRLTFLEIRGNLQDSVELVEISWGFHGDFSDFQQQNFESCVFFVFSEHFVHVEIQRRCHQQNWEKLRIVEGF